MKTYSTYLDIIQKEAEKVALSFIFEEYPANAIEILRSVDRFSKLSDDFIIYDCFEGLEAIDAASNIFELIDKLISFKLSHHSGELTV